jgi:hypothetical protein
MKKRLKIEGDPYSKMVQLMSTHGYNKDVNIVLGTVTAAPPDLKIQPDNMPFELDKDDLIVLEHLTNHKRTITIRKHPTEPTKIDINSTNVTEAMSVQGYIPHTHDVFSLGLVDVQNNFTFERAEIEYLDELKEGDRVSIACLDEDMTYIVLDRVVRYL